MTRSDPASFLAATPVFDRAAYAAAAGLSPDDPAVGAMLARHVQAGDIKHVAQEVFGTIPGGGGPGKYRPDPFLVAGWLRPGAVLAYHAALDLHGYAYSATSCLMQAFAPGDPSEITADGFIYDFLEPAPGIVLGDGPPADGIETVTFMGVDVRVTTIERTLADLFDRPEMCGATLVESLEFSYELDAAALVRHARTLGNAAAAGALGFWLESKRDAFGVDDATLRELRALAPRQERYALGAGPDMSLPAPGWNVVLPEGLVEPEFEGMRWSEM